MKRQHQPTDYLDPSRLWAPPVNATRTRQEAAPEDAEQERQRLAALRAWTIGSHITEGEPHTAAMVPLRLVTEWKETARRPNVVADALADVGSDGVYPVTRKEAKANGVQAARQSAALAAEFGGTEWALARQLMATCAFHGVEFPASEYGIAPTVARLSSPDWWGKKLRTADWRTYEMRKIRTGDVRRYCSDEIAQAMRWHRAAIENLLQNLYAARDDDGALFSLLELARKSNASPVIRRAEMIVRAKGLGRLAADAGWSWSFFTLTCPSKYHRLRYIENTDSYVLNRHWNGASPREAQEYLRKVWARVRAQLAREEIGYSAYRVAEPHRDGCPHWHGIAWAHPDHIARIEQVMREHGLREDGDENGAQEVRVTFRRFDASKATTADPVDQAIGYLIKYLSKNIDGRTANGGEVGDMTDRDGRKVDGGMVENAVRVTAWASLWGIRQFQEIGGPRVGPYRELRRLREPLQNEKEALETARLAADAGDYAEYARQADQLSLDLVKETSRGRLVAAAEDAGIDVLAAFGEAGERDNTERRIVAGIAASLGVFNRWGEPVRVWIKGVFSAKAECAVETRKHSWRVVSREQFQREAPAVAGELIAGLDRRKAEGGEQRQTVLQAVGAMVDRVRSALAFDFAERRSRAALDSCE